ncbi:MAG: NAD(+)/NADH kinase [Candidatus Brockarchaeota archaeon]|nr:NAD(+)/NADH kinase [Candidatus Brockarchaeota archaeon]
MDIVLAPTNVERPLLKKVLKTASSIGFEIKRLKSLEELERINEGVLLIIGEDRDALRSIRHLKSRNLLVLGVSKTENNSFLMETTVENIDDALKILYKGDYAIEYSSRIKAIVDDFETPHALNELAVFPRRSATIVEYSLYVDGEFVWRDIGDGLIVSTPIGSTAYALSTGGPIVHPHARVMTIVPVNSLNLTRRPLVVPLDSVIEIRDILSNSNCEVIVDGSYRVKAVNRILIKKGEDIGFIRLMSKTLLAQRLEKKAKMSIDISSLPPSAKLILKVLEYEGPLTQKDIVKKTMLPTRTVRHALAILVGKNFIKKKPLIRDSRQDLYYIETG